MAAVRAPSATDECVYLQPRGQGEDFAEVQWRKAKSLDLCQLPPGVARKLY